MVTICKVKVHGHLADLVAEAPSLNMKQFNGEFGCCVCLHPGGRLQGKGNVRVYPHFPEEPPRRNHQDTLLYAQVAEERGRSVFGVVGTSPFHRVLRIPDNILLDYMHLVLEGEFMRRLTLWVNSSGPHGHLHEHIGRLEAIMKNIKFFSWLQQEVEALQRNEEVERRRSSKLLPACQPSPPQTLPATGIFSPSVPLGVCNLVPDIWSG